MNVGGHVTREHELWALALWVDQEHGDGGEQFITERVLQFDAIGNKGGKDLWMDVARRFVRFRSCVTRAAN